MPPIFWCNKIEPIGDESWSAETRFGSHIQDAYDVQPRSAPKGNVDYFLYVIKYLLESGERCTLVGD